MNLFSLKDKKILITGATSGIGRAAAIACAKFGAEVIGIGRDPERLAAVRAELQAISPMPHEMLEFDVLKIEAIEERVGHIVKTHGKLNGFFGSVGISTTMALRAADAAYVQHLFDINVRQMIEFTRCFSSQRHSQNQSSIILASSVAAHSSSPGLSIYGATKGALHSFALQAARELAPRGTRVNVLAPGHLMDTAMSDVSNFQEHVQQEIIRAYPLGIGKVEDVIGGIIYLLSDASRWVTAQSLVIDGGKTC